MVDIIVALVIAETAFNGIAAGASLDQSINQLPARHRIGVVASSAYSQASDMGNGPFWYAGVGISAVLLSFATAVVAFLQRVSPVHAVPLDIVCRVVPAASAPHAHTGCSHPGRASALSGDSKAFRHLRPF